MLDEFRVKTKLFYKLKDKTNQDLTFLLNCTTNGSCWSFDTSHIPISDMSLVGIYAFVTNPCGIEGKPLCENPEFSAATESFSGERGNLVLKAAIIENKGDLQSMYNVLEKQYEEYSSAMAAKLQKAVPEGGEGSDNPLFHEADWYPIVFA